MAENTLALLKDCADSFAGAGIQTWLFGGWAEEVRGLCAPRPHKDIDLLYPAEDFSQIEAFIKQRDFEEIVPKRFVHKRAFLWDGVLVEVFLLQTIPTGYITNFFGLYQLEWPSGTLADDGPLPVASATALRLYRDGHEQVEDARRRYMDLMIHADEL